MKTGIVKILLIEDNPAAARIICEELKGAHDDRFKLECEGRLSSGLKRLDNGNIDVILLDLSLPDSQGYETFARVHTYVPDTPVIVLSSKRDELLAVKMVQAGAQDYLIKGEWDIGRMVRSIYYAMERQEVMKSLPSMLFVDNLTGLYDRDGLNILAEQQINIANCTKKGLFVIYININGMKWINDTIGHKEGEQVLIDAAGIFKETFRSSDIIARIGGDEFVIITIDARRDNAGIVESRLEENARIHGVMNNKRYRLSMSAGITYYDPENPVSFGELLTQAKNMMYEQKSSAGKFQMM